MDLNQIEIQRTGLLFFDMLNGYYHEASEDLVLEGAPKRHAGLLDTLAVDVHKPNHGNSTAVGRLQSNHVRS